MQAALPHTPDRPARPWHGAGNLDLQQKGGFARLQLADLGAQGGQFFDKRLVGHHRSPYVRYAPRLRPEG